MGLRDVGTYNPSSRLPSGALSDHAVYPAYAFDLGFAADTRQAARDYADMVVRDANVEYVILESRIWTRQSGSWRQYSHGGHETHVHVSGIR
jgi:hypothetical protein